MRSHDGRANDEAGRRLVLCPVSALLTQSRFGYLKVVASAAQSQRPQGIPVLVAGDERSGSFMPFGHAERSEVRERQRPLEPVGYADQHVLGAQRRGASGARSAGHVLPGSLMPFFFSPFCSTSGALAEDWNAGVSGEIAGTYRSGLHAILREARVRSGAVSPGLGPLMLFALIGVRGTAVRMRFRSLARYERRTLTPSVRMLALVGLPTAYGSAIPCR